MMAVLSTLNSPLPDLISRTALPTSAVTVPVFGFGISPRGPRILPSLERPRIMSGVATIASKANQPPCVFSISPTPRRPPLDAHAARSALDEVDRSLERRGVEIGQLGLGDRLHLRPSHLADLVAVRLARPLPHP